MEKAPRPRPRRRRFPEVERPEKPVRRPDDGKPSPGEVSASGRSPRGRMRWPRRHRRRSAVGEDGGSDAPTRSSPPTRRPRASTRRTAPARTARVGLPAGLLPRTRSGIRERERRRESPERDPRHPPRRPKGPQHVAPRSYSSAIDSFRSLRPPERSSVGRPRRGPAGRFRSLARSRRRRRPTREALRSGTEARRRPRGARPSGR